MPENLDDIPQIKPESILDPPQIKLTGSPGFVEVDKKETAKKIKKIKSKMRFKVPKFSFNFKKINLKASGKKKKILIGVGASFLALILLATFLLILPGMKLYKSSKALAASASTLKDSVNSQDINIVKGEYQNFKNQYEVFKKDFSRFSWVKPFPFVGFYIKDAQSILNASDEGLVAADIALDVITPYADIIGFGGPNTTENPDETANDRIEFIIQTVDDIIPRMDELTEKARNINSELSKIDPSRYPEEFRGIKVREQLTNTLNLVEEASLMLAESKPLLESAPYLLGIEEPRTYLLLFQNDKELRPTGGFITAYSIIQVASGNIQPVSSNDIYNLDSNYTPSVEAPEPIIEYLKGPYLISENYRLRDMNWSPDFRESIELFIKEAETAGVPDIDGIIAVDTHVVVNILNATGPIEAPGYGVFSTNNDERCNCPQVIYELESFADVEGPVVWSENEPGKIVFAPENYENRKEIVGPLMNAVLSNALGLPKERMPDLFEAGWRSMLEKHILVYFFDEHSQLGAEGFNIAGRIKDTEGDYFHVSDSNLGGRKSNLYVTHEVAHEVETTNDGSVTKTVTLTYQNPQDFDGWLNSVLPNWTRVYVPEGSELISSEGFDEETEVYTELGKTVFAGGFELRPQGVKKITLKYKIPNKFEDKYNLLIQKQPGKDAPLHSVVVNGKSEEFFLRTDKNYSTKI